MSIESCDEIGATLHARDRFEARATDPPDSVLAAWRDGEPVDIPARAPVPQHDEMRFDAVTDVVVCRRGLDLTTVYGLSSECLTNIHGVAVAAAVDAQFGTSYCARITPATLEEVNR